MEGGEENGKNIRGGTGSVSKCLKKKKIKVLKN